MDIIPPILAFLQEIRRDFLFSCESPEFFKGKKAIEIKLFFTEALNFIQKHQSKETIISAVVHVDEKTPHMHLCFVPLTEDKRLSVKEILGNKKKLTWWQYEFRKHMVKKYPDLERGESSNQTGRLHIPPRLFKEAVNLNRLKEQIVIIVSDTNLLNKKAKIEELEFLLGKYIPCVEAMRTKLKKVQQGIQGTVRRKCGTGKETG